MGTVFALSGWNAPAKNNPEGAELKLAQHGAEGGVLGKVESVDESP